MDASQVFASSFTEYELEFHPLTSGRLAAIDVWMQDNYRKQAIATASDIEMPPTLLGPYFRAMHETSAALSTATTGGGDIIRSLAGCLKLIEVSSDGKCTEKVLREQCKNDDEFMDAIANLNLRIRMLTDDPKPEDLEDDTDASDKKKADQPTSE